MVLAEGILEAEAGAIVGGRGVLYEDNLHGPASGVGREDRCMTC